MKKPEDSNSSIELTSNLSENLHASDSLDPPINRSRNAPSIYNKIINESESLKSLHLLKDFIERLNKNPEDAEAQVTKYIKDYGTSTKMIFDQRVIKELVPNLELDGSKRILKLYGIEPINLETSAIQKYFFKPHKYLLATLTNNATVKSLQDRIKFAFMVYDEDDKGYITKEELFKNLSYFGEQNALSLEEDSIRKIVDAIFIELNPSRSGKITLSEFEEFFAREKKDIRLDQFKRQGSVVEIRGKNDSVEKVRSHINPFEEKRGCMTVMRDKIRALLVGQRGYVSWVILWIIGALLLFIPVCNYYITRTGLDALGIAKGCAYVILFSLCWMLLIISKTFENLLRRSFLASVLPSKAFYKIHSKLGAIILILGTVHGLMHIVYDFRNLSNIQDVSVLNEIFESIGSSYTFTSVPTYLDWIASRPGITGIMILIIMSLMGLFAISKNRKKNYERFRYTHLMWIVVLPMLAIHGISGFFDTPKTLYWITPPAILLIYEKISMIIAYFSHKFQISELRLLSAGLIDLKIKKPSKFFYLAGQYALINIPEISRPQWHPFSFSSATYDDYIGFHIAPVGDWTTQLKNIAQERLKSGDPLPQVKILGPFGTPSQEFKRYKRLMIFATGVGATPFSSILKELLDKALTETGNGTTEYSIDFYWVNRKPSSYTWMSDLLLEVQKRDPERKILNVYMFFTSPQTKYDIRSFFLWTGFELLNKQGTKIPGIEHFENMHWGKPDWNDIFAKKSAMIDKGKVGVFFCGNKSLSIEIRDCCVKFSKKVKYIFHMESF